jgi:eukaryotic-like serine/threonine-protein kinase
VLLPGDQLGRFRLVRHLATGGMAEVYLARAGGIEGFEKLVVIKRILPQFSDDDEFVTMFLDEARLAAHLHHPNIVQVFDIGEQVGSYYYAMEFVQGHDVYEILRTARRFHRPLPLGCAVQIVVGMCRGLHYAHDKTDDSGRSLGIVHRDVSPSNVLVTFDGCTKVLDFGIAKASSSQTITRAGTLKGKISYMSPEQCRGEPLDRRSDVFAIGILLFEMTTGTRLFQGESELATLSKIANQDAPAPSERRADYPLQLQAIVLRALHRDRDQRYQSARDLQRDLELFVRDQRLAASQLDLADYLAELFTPDELQPPADADADDDDAVELSLSDAEVQAPDEAPTSPLPRPDDVPTAAPPNRARSHGLPSICPRLPGSSVLLAAAIAATTFAVALLLTRAGKGSQEPADTANREVAVDDDGAARSQAPSTGPARRDARAGPVAAPQPTRHAEPALTSAPREPPPVAGTQRRPARSSRSGAVDQAPPARRASRAAHLSAAGSEPSPPAPSLAPSLTPPGAEARPAPSSADGWDPDSPLLPGIH